MKKLISFLIAFLLIITTAFADTVNDPNLQPVPDSTTQSSNWAQYIPAEGEGVSGASILQDNSNDNTLTRKWVYEGGYTSVSETISVASTVWIQSSEYVPPVTQQVWVPPVTQQVWVPPVYQEKYVVDHVNVGFIVNRYAYWPNYSYIYIGYFDSNEIWHSNYSWLVAPGGFNYMSTLNSFYNSSYSSAQTFFITPDNWSFYCTGSDIVLNGTVWFYSPRYATDYNTAIETDVFYSLENVMVQPGYYKTVVVQPGYYQTVIVQPGYYKDTSHWETTTTYQTKQDMIYTVSPHWTEYESIIPQYQLKN